MAAQYSLIVCTLVVAVSLLNGIQAESGSGTTTRYWDCCKPSCSWKSNVSNMLKGPVETCDVHGQVADPDAKSGCEGGGTAFMCKRQQPTAFNSTTAYGFVAAKVPGKSLQDICCCCYKLTFPNEPKLAHKQMIVQVTNTGDDLEPGHFDIQMPGGGVGIFNGCTNQYNAPSGGWGDRYGGIHQVSECNQLPKELQPGCRFRFEWFANADNPKMEYTRVKCPKKLVRRSGCKRSDEPHGPNYHP